MVGCAQNRSTLEQTVKQQTTLRKRRPTAPEQKQTHTLKQTTAAEQAISAKGRGGDVSSAMIAAPWRRFTAARYSSSLFSFWARFSNLAPVNRARTKRHTGRRGSSNNAFRASEAVSLGWPGIGFGFELEGESPGSTATLGAAYEPSKSSGRRDGGVGWCVWGRGH